MTTWIRKLFGNHWKLIYDGFPYESYRLFNPKLGRYLKAGSDYDRAVRWKHKLNRWGLFNGAMVI